MKKISVIMPAYNAEKYIAKSIESVMNQTYDNWELLVVNDGSTDNTEEIATRYANIDSRVRVLTQENRGECGARNLGLEEATGDYISCLDSDDLYDREALSKLYKTMLQDEERKFVYGRTLEVFTNGKKELLGPADLVNGYLESFIHKNNEFRLRFHISALLIERALLEENNIRFHQGIKISGDTGFIIEVLAVTPAYGINDIVSYYMRRDDSITGIKKWIPENWEGQTVIYERTEDFVAKNRPQALEAFYKNRNFAAYRYVLNCIRHGFLDIANNHLKSWENYLTSFYQADGRINDRIKCKMLLLFRDNNKMLKLIGRL